MIRLPARFWLYFAGQTISATRSAITTVALPLLVLRLSGSAADLGAINAVNYLPWLLFGLLGGAVLDRIDRRRAAITVDSARGLVIAVIPLLAATGTLTVGWVFAVAFVQATLGVLYGGGGFFAVRALVEPDQLNTANARQAAGNSAATVAGSALAGLLFAVAPVTDGLWVDGATFLVSAATLAAVHRSFNTTPPPGLGSLRGLARSLLDDIKEGLSFVWRHKLLLAISSELVAVNLFGSAATAQTALYATRQLGAGNAGTGVFYAAGGIGVIVLSFVVGRLGRRLSVRHMILLALLLYGGGTAVMGLLTTYGPALVVSATVGGATVLYNVTTTTARQRMVPDEFQGRAWNIALAFAWCAIPVGSFVGGELISAGTSVGAIYTAVGLAVVVIAVVYDRLAFRSV